MKATAREKIPVQVQPESNPVPEAVQNHRQQQRQEDDGEDDELGIVKRAKESDFTAFSMQDKASNSEDSVEAESLKKYLDGENPR